MIVHDRTRRIGWPIRLYLSTNLCLCILGLTRLCTLRTYVLVHGSVLESAHPAHLVRQLLGRLATTRRQERFPAPSDREVGEGRGAVLRWYDLRMYFIVVKYQVKPEFVDTFFEHTAEFTASTRAEPGNLWFDWYRSVEDANEFVLVEAFADDDAASAHVNSDHFTKGIEAMRPALASTPKIVSRKVEGSGWDEMGELKIEN